MIDQGWELAGYLNHLAENDVRALELYTKGLDEDRFGKPNRSSEVCH